MLRRWMTVVEALEGAGSMPLTDVEGTPAAPARRCSCVRIDPPRRITGARPRTWRIGMVELPLRGAGGERVDLQRTLRSHGVAGLPPNLIADGVRLSTVLPAGG